MNTEAFDADIVVPPITLPDALVAASISVPPALSKGNEPGEVVILIEAETYSGM